MYVRRFLVAIAAVSLLGACGDDSPGAGNNTGPGVDAGPQVDLIAAPGVTLTEVSIYQGPKCVLMSGGVAQGCDVTLINGRDALFRVFYTAEQAVLGQPYRGVLVINGEKTYEVTGNFGPTSNEENFMSTANFVVPGEDINQFLTYQVSLRVEGDPAANNPAAQFPPAGVQPVTVDGVINTLRVILAPFAYWADGSGRVPNLTAPRLEEFRQRFLQLYPVTDVEVTARAPYDWNQTISPDGTGWQQVGMTLLNFRSQDGTSADVYYYGIFNPTQNFSGFCMSGCLLGVTLLNDNPPDTGDPSLRLALGVGFDEVAVDTSAHEIGHAHGLEHVNCGMGVDPSSVDPAYPYANNSIGVWSWDIVGEQMKAPDDYSDIMGYCDTQWISDYHYNKLYRRSMHVNMPWYRPPTIAPVSYQLISVDGEGAGIIRPGVLHRGRELGGSATEVMVYADQGDAAQVTGQYFRFDHLPGGWLFVPEQTFRMDSAEFTIRGVPTWAERPIHAR